MIHRNDAIQIEEIRWDKVALAQLSTHNSSGFGSFSYIKKVMSNRRLLRRSFLLFCKFLLQLTCDICDKASRADFFRNMRP
ncbi:hypothetical protein R6Q59_005700 [Mikania micrantha]